MHYLEHVKNKKKKIKTKSEEVAPEICLYANE